MRHHAVTAGAIVAALALLYAPLALICIYGLDLKIDGEVFARSVVAVPGVGAVVALVLVSRVSSVEGTPGDRRRVAIVRMLAGLALASALFWGAVTWIGGALAIR